MVNFGKFELVPNETLSYFVLVTSYPGFDKPPRLSNLIDNQSAIYQKCDNIPSLISLDKIKFHLRRERSYWSPINIVFINYKRLKSTKNIFTNKCLIYYREESIINQVSILPWFSFDMISSNSSILTEYSSRYIGICLRTNPSIFSLVPRS